jgi:hypothetical protein
MNAFRRVEAAVKQSAPIDLAQARFLTQLEAASERHRIVRRHRRRVEAMAALRNALTHQGWSNGEPVAEPALGVVLELERIAGHLEHPPPLPQSVLCDVRTFDLLADLGDVLEFMHASEFSQVPVLREGSFHALLTSNTITRWLASNVTQGLAETRGIALSGVLSHGEPSMDACCFARTQDDCATVLALFQTGAYPARVVLLSDSGRPDPRIKGIVTAADLPALHERLEDRTPWVVREGITRRDDSLMKPPLESAAPSLESHEAGARKSGS